MASDHDSKSYLKLAQFYAAMSAESINMDKKLALLSRILDQEGDINYKVPNTPGALKSSNTDLAGCTVLHLIYQKSFGRDTQSFNLLLDRDADITCTNSKGQTVVHECIYNISRDDCRSLSRSPRQNRDPFVKESLSAHLRFHVTANPVDPNGLSHFHAASMTNDAKAIEFFLDNGVSIDQSVNADSPIFAGYTPLHFATRFFCLDAVRLLLARGARIDIQDAAKMTPLHLIVSNILSHREKTDYSLEECINVLREITENEKKVQAQEQLGLSYLHVLCIFKDSSMLERHLRDNEYTDCTVNADSPICPGYTPLHFAALFDLDSVKLLLAKGADIRIKDAGGVTPLDLCTARHNFEDIRDIIAQLEDVTLSNGRTKLTELIYSMRSPSDFCALLRELGDANANIPVDSPLWPGYTALHLAIVFHEVCNKKDEKMKKVLHELINVCLKNGSDVSAKGVLELTPLQFAFRRGCFEAINLMLKYHRGTSNQVDADGLSHLHIACAAGNKDVVQALLSNGADVNCKLGSTFTWHFGHRLNRRVFLCRGSTPLHIAVATGNREMTKLLLQRGADLQAQDVNGMSPVHRLISSHGSQEICNELLSSSDLRECLVDDCGLSHLHVACLMGHPGAVKKLLFEFGSRVDRIIDCKTTSELHDDARRYRIRDDRYGDPSNEDPLLILSPFAGYTSLHLAIRHQHNAQTVKLLLQHGADIFAKSFAGSIPLYSAMSGSSNSVIHAYNYWPNFVAMLKRDDELRRRVGERVSGLTDLHLACFGREVRWVKQLLTGGADVNARVRGDSPIWPEHTPLHVLRRILICGGKDAETVFQMLVSHGADVAMSNGGFTSLQSVWSPKGLLHETLALDYKHPHATSMIRGIRDFSRNPTTHLGSSHFHIVCSYHEVDAVEGFLNAGVDVNAKIDYFAKYHAGCTPLHVTLSFRGDLPPKVKIVELLLKHGADVRAEDVYGDTPLHYAAKNCNDELFFRMLVDAEADMDAKNVNNETPVDILLKKGSVKMKTIELIIKHGYQVNSFNSATGEGLIPITCEKLSCNFEGIKTFILSLPNIHELDEMGRSAIHNIVSARSSSSWKLGYANLIEDFEKLGYDVNHQDKSGRTALHTAVQLKNHGAITALLAAGADINIVDNQGKTAYANALDLCGVHKPNYQRYPNDVIDLLTTHVHKLQLAGIHVSAQNARTKEIVLDKPGQFTTVMNEQRFRAVSNSMEKAKVGSRSLTLADVIFETADVRKYSKMTVADRDAVVEYFESILNANNDRKLGKLKCLVKLQHRNLSTRSKLVNAAKLALDTLAKMPVPDLCSAAIFASFENWELRNVIAAVN